VPGPSKTLSPPLPRSSKIFIGLFVLLSILNVVGAFLTDRSLQHFTKPLLMPLLLLAVLFAAGAALRGFVGLWLVIGMVFGWLGDLALMGSGDVWFGLGMGAFLIMQICYIVALLRIGRPGFVRAWPFASVPYVLLWIVMNFFLWSAAGTFAVPVLIYSAALVLMGILALNAVLAMKHWWIAVGGLLFVISDGVLSLAAFERIPDSSWTDAVVMSTYCAAQLIIAISIARWVRTADEVRRA